MQMEKTMGPNSLPITYYGNHWPTFPPGWKKPPFIRTDGFLDKSVRSLRNKYVDIKIADKHSYYDDEGWWSLAWIAAYDITGDTRYLQMAESIFSNMAAAYNTTPCGGLWWDKVGNQFIWQLLAAGSVTGVIYPYPMLIAIDGRLVWRIFNIPAQTLSVAVISTAT